MGEEGAAYAGLFADGADAEGGEASRADEAAAFEEEESGFFEVDFGGLVLGASVSSGGVAVWTMMARRLGMGRTISVGEGLDGFNFLPLGVEGGGLFELHAGGRLLRGRGRSR